MAHICAQSIQIVIIVNDWRKLCRLLSSQYVQGQSLQCIKRHKHVLPLPVVLWRHVAPVVQLVKCFNGCLVGARLHCNSPGAIGGAGLAVKAAACKPRAMRTSARCLTPCNPEQTPCVVGFPMVCIRRCTWPTCTNHRHF